MAGVEIGGLVGAGWWALGAAFERWAGVGCSGWVWCVREPAGAVVLELVQVGLPGLVCQRCGKVTGEQGTGGGSTREPPTAIGGMMAAIFLVLAVVDAALLGNVALTNTSASSVSVFNQLITGFTQGELLLVAAGLGLLLALFVGIAWSSSSARRAKHRGLRVARREVEGRVAELERENARLRKELEGTRRPGVLVGPQGAFSEAP
jgi:hypothetical protein